MHETWVDVIRHGSPEGGSRYRGHGVDDPLSAEGWQQMWAAVGSSRPWQSIYSSPMRRCREFAQQLGAEGGVPLHIVDELKEVGFGSWEGKTKQELQRSDPKGFAAFYQDPIKHPPAGAERLPAFCDRVQVAYQKIVDSTNHERILIVAHAGVMRAILAGVLNLDAEAMYRVTIQNAGILRLLHERGGQVKLELLNGKLA